ncbi:MAG: hypothetical protein WBA92_00045 [Pseudorhodobacter sp.]
MIRFLDQCLDRVSNGVYALSWDSENVMVAEFAQTNVILVAGHDIAPHSGFTLTLAVSPKDLDALADPAISTCYRSLIEDLVATFKICGETHGVFWQRAAAPITAEAVEAIAQALADKLATFDKPPLLLPKGADSFERAQILPTTAFSLQSAPRLPI